MSDEIIGTINIEVRSKGDKLVASAFVGVHDAGVARYEGDEELTARVVWEVAKQYLLAGIENDITTGETSE